MDTIKELKAILDKTEKDQDIDAFKSIEKNLITLFINNKKLFTQINLKEKIIKEIQRNYQKKLMVCNSDDIYN